MAKRKSAIIDDREYPVVDRLGYQHSIGMYAIEVMDGDEERVAVSSNNRSPWQWNRPALLVAPPRKAGE